MSNIKPCGIEMPQYGCIDETLLLPVSERYEVKCQFCGRQTVFLTPHISDTKWQEYADYCRRVANKALHDYFMVMRITGHDDKTIRRLTEIMLQETIENKQ